jgi:hypothetical protein
MPRPKQIHPALAPANSTPPMPRRLPDDMGARTEALITDSYASVLADFDDLLRHVSIERAMALIEELQDDLRLRSDAMRSGKRRIIDTSQEPTAPTSDEL